MLNRAGNPEPELGAYVAEENWGSFESPSWQAKRHLAYYIILITLIVADSA